jgi:lipoprotein-anchoring transpeptidase ErfK/SrfK
MPRRTSSAERLATASFALLCLVQLNTLLSADAVQPKHFPANKNESKDAKPNKAEQKTAAKADSKTAGKKPASVFVDNKFRLGKTIGKNGFHKGEPVVFLVDKGSHYTHVLQLQKNHLVEVYKASNAIGKDDTPTPFGPYHVADKLKYPSWIPPKSIDPKQKVVPPYNKTHKNPLGVARITLDKFGIALHGTNDPNSLRHDVSHGCIRHSNKDIMKLYDMASVGDTVIIAKAFSGTEIGRDQFINKHKH